MATWICSGGHLLFIRFFKKGGGAYHFDFICGEGNQKTNLKSAKKLKEQASV